MKNGCHNRAPFPLSVGFARVVHAINSDAEWEPFVVVKKYPFRFTRDCQYDKRTADRGCEGCKWRTQ